MDSIDLDILKWMTRRDDYYELKDQINRGLCIKESWQLIQDFGEYFKAHKDEDQINDDFKLWSRTQRHSSWAPDKVLQWNQIIDTVLTREEPERASFLESIDAMRGQAYFTSIADRVGDGTIGIDEAIHEARAFIPHKKSGSESTEILTLDSISSQARTGAFYWRLEDLNQSIGPLHKGDFIVVAKRPEVGGTSFIVSELSYMLEQCDGNAILLNNEEEQGKVYSRMVSAAINVDYKTLMSDTARYQAEYEQWLGGRTWHLEHNTNMTVSSIYEALEERPYDLIAINVLLKVGVPGSKEDHDKLQELGTECRKIAEEYGPVFAIVQADPSAEGMQYIPQDRIYKSKTALQGEADGLIMIGTDEQIVDDVRYIHVAKNKIPPAPCTDSKCKHIKTRVNFDYETGRFTSNNFSTHSRSK